MNATLKELEEERAGVASLLGMSGASIDRTASR